MRIACLALSLLSMAAIQASTRLIVTVVEERTGRPVADLEHSDFAITDQRESLIVEKAEFKQDPIDVMLLLDASLVGEPLQPIAANLIEQLGPKEQMAIVAFHSSADMVQEFTSSKDLLRHSIRSLKFGNSPRVLDALFAAIDGGFDNSSFRRVILLLTAGIDAPSRVSETEVVRLSRKSGVSIYPVYMSGYGRHLFDDLARRTGGASFSLRDLRKTSTAPGPRVFEVVRGHYLVTLKGNPAVSDRLKVEVPRRDKVDVSAMALE